MVSEFLGLVADINDGPLCLVAVPLVPVWHHDLAHSFARRSLIFGLILVSAHFHNIASNWNITRRVTSSQSGHHNEPHSVFHCRWVSHQDPDLVHLVGALHSQLHFWLQLVDFLRRHVTVASAIFVLVCLQHSIYQGLGGVEPERERCLQNLQARFAIHRGGFATASNCSSKVFFCSSTSVSKSLSLPCSWAMSPSIPPSSLSSSSEVTSRTVDICCIERGISACICCCRSWSSQSACHSALRPVPYSCSRSCDTSRHILNPLARSTKLPQTFRETASWITLGSRFFPKLLSLSCWFVFGKW